MSVSRVLPLVRALGLGLLAHVATAGVAQASCGAESCPLNSSALGGPAPRFSLDFSYLYVDQNRLKSGTHSSDLDAVYASGGEVRTISHISTVTANYSLRSKWLATASLPMIDRLHRHVTAELPTGPELREWQFSGLGDLRLLATGPVWSTSSESAPSTIAVQAGIKLPTGRRHVPAIDGEEPEPHARPGTGATDLMAGLQFNQTVPLAGSNPMALFASALYTHTGLGTEDYRIGKMLELHLGAGYSRVDRLRLQAQVSCSMRDKDRSEADHESTGEHAGHEEEVGGEHENTGGTSVFAAPGLQYDVSPWLALSSYVQLPVYQRANGTQLVAPWQLWIGTSYKLP